MRQIARLIHRFAQKSFDLVRFRGQVSAAAFFQIDFQCTRGATDRGQKLAKSIVQIAPDSLLFVFADLNDLLFELLSMLKERDACLRCAVPFAHRDSCESH